MRVQNSPAPTPLAPLVAEVELSSRASGWALQRQNPPHAHTSATLEPGPRGTRPGSLVRILALAGTAVFCLWLSCTIVCTFPAELARRRRVLISPGSQQAAAVISKPQQAAKVERMAGEDRKILAGHHAPVYVAREPLRNVDQMQGSQQLSESDDDDTTQAPV